MLVKDFIQNSLDKIHKIFPKSHLEYQYKAISNTHFIKISPKSYFSEDAFIDLDFELSDKFRELDFSGSLCFLTDDSIVTLDNPSIVVTPLVVPTPSLDHIPSFQPMDDITSAFLSKIIIGENDVEIGFSQTENYDIIKPESCQRLAMAA